MGQDGQGTINGVSSGYIFITGGYLSSVLGPFQAETPERFMTGMQNQALCFFPLPLAFVSNKSLEQNKRHQFYQTYLCSLV